MVCAIMADYPLLAAHATEATDIPKDPSRTSRSADYCSLPALCFLEIGTDAQYKKHPKLEPLRLAWDVF
jgi:hypothetical protein